MSLCDSCKYRWSNSGKLYCTISQFYKCNYSKRKKGCPSYEKGQNDKYFRGKQGKNRTKKRW